MDRQAVHSSRVRLRRLTVSALLALSLLSSAVGAADPSLIAWYKLDDGGGTTAADSSGNNYTGTLVNSPLWSSGIIGGALQFNGSTNYVSVPTSPDVSGGSFSLAAWINTSATGVAQKFIDKWNDNSGNFQFSIQVYQDQRVWLSVRQTNGVEAIARGSTIINPHRWYHAAAVVDTAAKTLTIYINGVAETLQVDPGWDGTVRSLAMEMALGRKCTGTDYFSGLIDDARVYNRALAAAEVQALVSAAPPVANVDSYTVGFNHTLSVAAPGVLGNDYDISAQTLTATKLSDPAQGALTLNGDGSFSFTPPNGFSGVVSFTYQATNTSARASTATVTLNVAPPTLSVSAMIPTAGSTLTAVPPEIDVTFSSPPDQTTATTDSVTLWRRGPDGIWDTADDVQIPLTSAQIQFVSATQMKIDLSGMNLPSDRYRVVLDGTVKGYEVRSGNFMNVPNFGMSVPTDEMTVEFWQKFEGGEFHIPTTFGLEPENTANRFKVNSPWNSYDYLFFGFGATTYGIQYVNTRGTWHHIAGVCSKSQNSMSVYLDGSLIGTNAGMTPFVRYAADLQIPNADFQPFIGAVDEFRIWNVARTAAQIKACYRKNLRGNEPGLVAYWDFNGNDGTGSTVSDVSPNGYTGTLSGISPASWPLSDAPLNQGLADTSGNILDGDGDGFAGGDFVSEFEISLPPTLGIAPAGTLTFAVVAGSNPADQTLNISNFGTGSFTFTAATDAAWLTVTPTTDTITTQTDALTVHVDASTLTAANSPYLQNITIAAPGALSAPQVVPVKVVVIASNSGQVGWWKLDETSGTIAHDSSGASNDGATVNGPVWAVGEINGALNFNGSNQYVDIPTNATLDIQQSDFTVAAWIKPDPSSTSRVIVSKERNGVGAGQFRFYLEPNNTLGFVIVDQSDGTFPFDSSTAVPNSVWTHVAVTRSGTSHVLYINGAVTGTKTTATVINHTNSLNLRIGSRYTPGSGNGPDWCFPGSIDDVQFYRRALSQIEISTLAKTVITDTNGVALDGEFNGPSLPSGNGTPGGNYVATFTISTPKLTVTQLTPTAGATLTAVPASVTATLSKDIDPATVNSNTVVLTRAGTDGVLGTGDDVTIVPASVSVSGTNIVKVDLTGVVMPTMCIRFACWVGRPRISPI